MPLPETVILKLERASEHLESLKDEVAARVRDFRRDGVARERDAETGDYVWIVRASPDDLGLVRKIAGDYVHNLRSALDHLIYSMSAEPNRRPLPEFPIYEAPGPGSGAFQDAGVKKIWSIPGEAKLIVERLQPYHGGNQSLLAIHTLDVVDKHRNLIATPYAIRGSMLKLPPPREVKDLADGGKVAVLIRGYRVRAGPFRFGDEVARLSSANPPESVEKTDIDFTYQIAVEEKGVSGEIVTRLAPLYEYVRDELLPQFEPFFE